MSKKYTKIERYKQVNSFGIPSKVEMVANYVNKFLKNLKFHKTLLGSATKVNVLLHCSETGDEGDRDVTITLKFFTCSLNSQNEVVEEKLLAVLTDSEQTVNKYPELLIKDDKVANFMLGEVKNDLFNEYYTEIMKAETCDIIYDIAI